ncbi:hypothetical protein [Bacillus sp. Hm123]|uniref:hypothetical protein n=1 Tax=Bacillus sp. Hm123 TaxID=3450745 RepID=UPI003F42C515
MLLILLFIWNAVALYSVYRMLKKKQLLLDERFSMTMCMAITMTSSFILALHFELSLPSVGSFLYFIPILLSIFIGWHFGGMMRNPAKLISIYNSAMGAIMGTMLAAVLKNPALCNIPIDSEAMLTTNIYSLALFTTILHTLTMVMIRYSFRV